MNGKIARSDDQNSVISLRIIWSQQTKFNEQINFEDCFYGP